MRIRRLIVLVAVLAVVAAACGGGSDETTTTAAGTEAPTTTVAETTTTTTAAPTTTAGTEAPVSLTSDVGFDEATGVISLGVLAALTGPIPDIGASVLAGHEIYWAKVNDNGGVAGTFPIELVTRDNGYNPEETVVVYNEIKDQVVAFSSTLGTPTTAPIQGPAAEEDILIAAGSGASQWALTPNLLLNLAGIHYFAQFANAPYWASEIADPPVITDASVVGIIYQADDYGQDCKDGYDFAQENLGFNAAYENTYAAGDSDFSAQIAGAQAAGVDVLFVCTLPSALAAMIGTAAQLQYAPAIFGSSPSYNVVLPAALGGGDEAAGVGLFNSFPYYNLGTSPSWEDDLPGMMAMRDDWDTYGADRPPELVNFFSWFGYTQAQSFHAVLETAVAAGDITRAGLVEAVNSTTGVDLGMGVGSTGYGPAPLDRIPTNQDLVGVVTTLDQRRFGLEPVGMNYEAPYMVDWDPAG